MITVLHSDSPYLVVERKHLKEILREQDSRKAVWSISTPRFARHSWQRGLAPAGQFLRQGDIVTIQVRLIRVSDQRVLTQVTWTDRYDKVLSAPGCPQSAATGKPRANR